MVTLKKLQIDDFLSHRETEIVFNDVEKILIDGNSGSGKSSIFDAIVWALYGVGRADNRSMIRKGAKEARVKLTLKKDDEVIVVFRSVSNKGKHTIAIFTEQTDGSLLSYPLAGVREIQAWIEKDLIGASYLLFVNSIAYIQGNSDSFVSQNASKRKELLLEIVKAEDYNKYYEKARQVIQKLESEIVMSSGQYTELDRHFKSIMSRVGDRSEQNKIIKNAQKFVENLEPSIKELESEKALLSTALLEAESIERDLSNTQNELVSLKLDLDKKKSKVQEKVVLTPLLELIPEREKNIEETRDRLLYLRNSLKLVSEVEAKRNEFLSRKPYLSEANIDQIGEILSQMRIISEQPICPGGDSCPYSGDNTSRLASLKEQLSQRQKALSDETIVLASWEREKENLPPKPDIETILNDIEHTEKLISKLEEDLADVLAIKVKIEALSEIEAEIPSIETNIKAKELRISELKEKQEKSDLHVNREKTEEISNRIEEIRSSINDANTTIVMAKSTLESIERDEQEMNDIKAKIDFIKKDKLPSLDTKLKKVRLVKDAFGEKGIKTIVIDYLLSSLEDKVNSILGRLSDFQIRFDTQRSSSTGESTIEGLFITVCNEIGEEMPFESYSGGEKVRIVFSISEALASLSSKNIGFRLVDEAVLALDDNSLESFMDVVGTLLTDFDQVMFISHIQGVKDLFDKRIKVKKKNAVSKVEL